MRALFLALALLFALGAPADARPRSAGAVAGRRIGQPSFDLNFLSTSLPATFFYQRTTTATDLLSTAGSATFNSYGVNVHRINPTLGALIEEARTNYLLNSGTPASQTTGTLPATGQGFYTLWIIGSGSASVAAGTATGTGFGTATQGSPIVFNITVGGTVVVTVSGSVSVFQLEDGPGPSSYIPTTSATVARAADILRITNSAFTPWQGSLAITFIPLSGGFNATDNHVACQNLGGTELAFFSDGGIVVAGAGSTLQHPTHAAYGVQHKIAMSYGLRGQSVSYDGLPLAYTNTYTPVAPMNAWPPTCTIFNENTTEEIGSGWVQRLRRWTYQLSPEMIFQLGIDR